MKAHRIFCAALFAVAAPGLATAQLVTYEFQGTDFTDVVGTQFATSDSVTGSLSILNPPEDGACSGIGGGPGQCAITAASFEASGTPGISTSLSGGGIANFFRLGFTDGEITSWRIPAGFISLQTPDSQGLIMPSQSAFVRGANGATASTPASNPGAWTLVSSVPVPEPTSLALAVGVLPLALGYRRRR